MILRVLALDIETRPALVYTWKLWEPIIGVEQIVNPGGMFCFAAKWVGERKTHFWSDHHDGHKTMVKQAWKLLDEADVVLHFNGESFDVPHMNREFMEHGLTPPSPFKQIDLYKTVKKRARFLSNKLAFVAPQLGLQGKVKHDGFSLWLRCMDGDENAWSKMRRYNIRDVTELEKAYEILKPWVPSHPSHAAFAGKDVCPKCGGDKLEKRGYAYTTQARFQRFCCKDCKSWSRSTTGGERVHVAQVA